MRSFPRFNSKKTKQGIVLKMSFFAVIMTVALGSLIYVQARLLIRETTMEVTVSEPLPFPVGVDPARKTITEQPAIDTYFKEQISSAVPSAKNWSSRTLAALSQYAWYQNLASLSSRILVIQAGERKEEIAQNIGKILRWDRRHKLEFLTAVIERDPILPEGKFMPHTYIVSRNIIPLEVANLVSRRFDREIYSRYPETIQKKVSLEDALIIASLLEREGKDFEDMRLISGIIWNRLFSGMKLQLDATLQYVKGSKNSQPWWPRVLPADKQLASPFNTYQNAGLPPSPISNPSANAILAALNPRKTDCMYYFHDKESLIHCSATYKEHVALIEKYY